MNCNMIKYPDNRQNTSKKMAVTRERETIELNKKGCPGASFVFAQFEESNMNR